ncbi:MAG: iron-containing alcohol dehydrogenase, partial [Ruminiclostridium sp.]
QDFISYLREVSKFGLDREALAGFYLSARRKHKREYYYEPTMDYLRGIHFDWPVISMEYIGKMVKYMKKINFLDVRMKNYVNYNPCKVYFGRSVIQYLPDEICKLGSRVLLLYGVNSIKENGIYEQVIELLEEKHINYCEYSGVKANPTIELVEKGIEICRTYGAEVILAVGGGSVIDCSKAIAAGVYNEKTVWELVEDNELVTKTVPVIAVLTVSGSGSEMDGICSLTNRAIPNKRGITSQKVIPKVSFLDPEYTASVPVNLSAAGVVDTISHLMEQYFQDTVQIQTQSAIIECMLEKCFKYGRRLMKEPQNYEVRTNLMYISTYAMNGFLYKEQNEDWSLHPIEHQLSAFYDITHGIGIGILLPEWLKAIFKTESYKKFYEYGVHVWGINPGVEEYEAGKLAIEKTKDFLIDLQMPKSLRSIGIQDKAHFDVMSERAYRTHISTSYLTLSKREICDIYEKVF